MSVPRALDHKHVWRWYTGAPLVAFLFVVGLTVLDPFGFESVTKRQSEKIIYKIYGAYYPSGIRDTIATVYLDKETLDFFNETWPPSHVVHSEILRGILSYKPAAVLVDLYFVRRGPNDNFERTEDVIQEYQDEAVPLFLVWDYDVRPEIWKRATDPSNKSPYRVRLVSGSLGSGDPGPPLYPVDKVRGLNPAALDLYRVICGISDESSPNSRGNSFTKIRSTASGCHEDRRILNETNLRSKQQMQIVWGLEPSNYNCQAFESLCSDLFVRARPIQLLWEALIPEQYRVTDPLKVHYHAEISAKRFFGENNRLELGSLLTGNVVMYSSNLSAAKDIFPAPIHGEVPGVLVHAMALDNFLTLGKRYIRQAEEGLFHRDLTELLPSILMFLASVSVIIWRWELLADSSIRTIDELRAEDERRLRCLYWALIGFIVVAGPIEFFVFRIAPFNWLGLWIVVHMAHRVDKWAFGVVEKEAEVAGWTRRPGAEESNRLGDKEAMP